MQSVVETPMFQNAAKSAGLTEKDVEAIVTFLARTPDAGDVIKGSGGCRKLRVAGRGKGKSGGYRLITFFSGPDIPLYLLAVYGKGDRSNLSDAQVNTLKALTKRLIDAHKTAG